VNVSKSGIGMRLDRCFSSHTKATVETNGMILGEPFVTA
jgi:hypothetical protein